MLSFSVEPRLFFPAVSGPGPVGAVIFDEDQYWGLGLASALLPNPGIKILGLAKSEPELGHAVGSLAPQVVLMRAAAIVNRRVTDAIALGRAKIVAVAMPTDSVAVLRAAAARANAIVASAGSPDSFSEVARVAAGGNHWVDHEVWHRILPELESPAEKDKLSALTERERQVLVSVASGKSNREVAGALNLGLTTVKTHIAAVMGKIGVCNRVELALAAYRGGLVE